MVYLNFTDLSEEAQNRLLEDSKKDVERKFGDDIRKYVRENYTCFETMIEQLGKFARERVGWSGGELIFII